MWFLSSHSTENCLRRETCNKNTFLQLWKGGKGVHWVPFTVGINSINVLRGVVCNISAPTVVQFQHQGEVRFRYFMWGVYVYFKKHNEGTRMHSSSVNVALKSWLLSRMCCSALHCWNDQMLLLILKDQLREFLIIRIFFCLCVMLFFFLQNLSEYFTVSLLKPWHISEELWQVKPPPPVT